MNAIQFPWPLPTDVPELARLLDQFETAYGAHSPETRALYTTMQEQEGVAEARLLWIRAGRIYDWLDDTAPPAEVEIPGPTYSPQGEPYWATFFSYTDPDDDLALPSSVVVELATGHAPATNDIRDQSAVRFADGLGEVQLIQVDTNYKPDRTSDNAAKLRRADAIKLSAALLAATSHSFSFTKLGRLRPAQAADLLEVLRDTERQLGELRDHLMEDLVDGVGLSETPNDEGGEAK